MTLNLEASVLPFVDEYSPDLRLERVGGITGLCTTHGGHAYLCDQLAARERFASNDEFKSQVGQVKYR